MARKRNAAKLRTHELDVSRLAQDEAPSASPAGLSESDLSPNERAQRIEFFRREDDARMSGCVLDAGGKASLNGDGGRLWGFKVGLELEMVKVACRGVPREPEMTGRMGRAAL